jgi:hypothetical protein
MSLAAPLRQVAEARSAAPAYEATPLVLALAVFALACFAPAVLGDGDTWTHLATGNWILEHRAIPRVDPFTFSFAGAPWIAHEWLADVLFAIARRAAGWSGVTWLTGAAAGGAVYVVARRAARDLTGPALIVLAVLALGLLLPSLLARPHILALPVLAIWCDGLFAARERGRAPRIAFAALMAPWANLHGGFAFGLALIGAFALEALIEASPQARLAVFREWALFGLASLAAALITPFGIEGLLFPIRLLQASELANVGEWRPENFAHPGPMEFALLGLIGLAVLKPLRLTPVRAALLLGLVHISLQHARHEMLLAILAPMLLARPIADALGARPADPAPPPARRYVLAALGLALCVSGARLALPIARGDGPSAPMSALASVPVELRERPVLNAYSFGGFLIHAGVRPFIDGRADMFGDAFMSLYARLQDGDPDALAETLKRYPIGWTIFAPSQKIVSELDRAPGWRRLYADRFAVVHARVTIPGN